MRSRSEKNIEFMNYLLPTRPRKEIRQTISHTGVAVLVEFFLSRKSCRQRSRDKESERVTEDTMAESRSIEIYEIEFYSGGKWMPDEQRNWTNLENQPSRPPDELTLPNNEWCWESNWRIIKKPGATDRSGWEYA
jgi:hypothetical protein